MKFGITCYSDNREFIKNADVIVLCVKPSQAKEVLEKNAKYFTGTQLLISICAGLTTAQLKKWTKARIPVIRAMTNTPAIVNSAMTVLSGGGTDITKDQMALATTVFSSVGRVTEVENLLWME